jgi:long-subunit fatty acid transport protein
MCHIPVQAFVFACASSFCSHLAASDLYRIGASPKSLGMGSVAALARDPLSAMSANPALLSGLPKQVAVSIESMLVDADLSTRTGEQTSADKGPAFVPQVAAAFPLRNALTLGLAAQVQSGMRASFDYTDPAGTLGVSYGRQVHESEYLVFNSSAALAWKVSEDLTLGVQLGLAWNRNRLKAPYIFQSHPALKSLKVLVDLEVDDISPSFALGLDYRLNDATTINLAWGMENRFSSEGELDGNLARLGLGIQEDFHYQAEVETGLPAYLTLGLTHQFSPVLRGGLQVDWINWKETFRALPIHLGNGSNNDLNAFLGTSSIEDIAPLAWDNQVVVHLGGEYLWDRRKLRFGYEHADVPVPTATFTPMTGAIFSHALMAGTEFNAANAVIDLFYRFSTSGGATRVNNSVLLGGEHNNQALELALHTVGISFSF